MQVSSVDISSSHHSTNSVTVQKAEELIYKNTTFLLANSVSDEPIYHFAVLGNTTKETLVVEKLFQQSEMISSEGPNQESLWNVCPRQKSGISLQGKVDRDLLVPASAAVLLVA